MKVPEVFGMLLFILVTVIGEAGQPPRFNYQGRLTDASGIALAGAHTFYFSVYQGGTDSGGGTLAYRESVSLVPEEGVVNHAVGTGTIISGVINAALFRYDGDIFLEVAVDSLTNTVSPRTRLDSVPFAITSADGDPRTAISAPVSYPLVITEPGAYYLTENLAATAATGIEIQTDNVTLDLNGFSLTGSGSGYGVLASGTSIAVRNGTVAGFYIGIYCTGDNASVVDLRVSDCGRDGIVVYGNASHVLNCVVSGNRGDGIYLSENGLISNCMAFNNGSSNNDDGIVAFRHTTISNCTSTSNSSAGIRAYGGCNIAGCTTSRNGREGIALTGSGSQVRGCTSSENLGEGVGGIGSFCVADTICFNNRGYGISGAIADGSTLSNCVVTSNSGAGVYIRSSAVITGCVARANGADGISAGKASVLTGCTSEQNFAVGIRADDGSLVTACVSTNNGTSEYYVYDFCSVINNNMTETGNDASGLIVFGSGNRIEGNNAAGFWTGYSAPNPGNLLIRNSGYDNVTDFSVGASNFTGTVVTTEAAMNGATNSLVNIAY